MMTENRSLFFLFFSAIDIGQNLIQSLSLFKLNTEKSLSQIAVGICLGFTLCGNNIFSNEDLSLDSDFSVISSTLDSYQQFHTISEVIKKTPRYIFFLPLVISNKDMHNQIQKYSLQIKAIIYLFILVSQKQLMCFFFKPLFLIYLIVMCFSKHPCYFLNSEANVYRTHKKYAS